jgi:hypothetical protein
MGTYCIVAAHLIALSIGRSQQLAASESFSCLASNRTSQLNLPKGRIFAVSRVDVVYAGQYARRKVLEYEECLDIGLVLTL